MIAALKTCRPIASARSRQAISLIEILVVLFIIALLLGLLFPALQSSRESARQATCETNLHQLAIALTHFVEVRRKLPDPAPDGAIGGWAIAILPFLEETNLAHGLSGNPPLDPVSPLAVARDRPAIMTCPSSYLGDSSIPTVPASHYSAIFVRHSNPDKNQWLIGELPTDSRIPWVVSPELAFGGSPESRPHSGGFFQVSGSGGRAYGVLFTGPDE